MFNGSQNDAGVMCPPQQSQAKFISAEREYYAKWGSSFGKFEENLSYRQEELEYPRNGTEPGLVLIFNQETFEKGQARRDGSIRDVAELVTCLSRLGFNINRDYIFTDLKKEEIFNNIDKILASDLSQVNSVLVFVLTHGGYSNTLHSSSACFVADDMWLKFVECPQLKDKPKMFIIQACKGDEDTTFQTNNDAVLVPMSTFSCQRIHPDMLIVFSTMEGKYALRHTTNGTWLIQELCKNFTAYGRRDDVLTLLARVTKCICKNYYDEKPNEIIKQMPVIVSTLSKKFYLNKNKDRHFIIQLEENQRTIRKMAENICRNVKYLYGDDEDKKNNKEKQKTQQRQ